jgi:molybdate transport system substrate-binding protein
VALATAGCTASTGQTRGGDQKLTVLAAASLTESFDTLAKRFEAAHPGVEVAASYDSSATIAAQVDAGAPADVVATADTRTMRAMERGDSLATAPAVFARNRLVLVVPSDNPAGIGSLADLQHADYVVCVRSAPCGDLASRVLAGTGVTNRPRSYEVDVKAVLTKVQTGEADAGFVYASDVVAAGDSVREIPVPRSATPATDYPIAVTADSAHPDLARQWVDLVRSPEGRRVLAKAGFTPATGAGASP